MQAKKVIKMEINKVNVEKFRETVEKARKDPATGQLPRQRSALAESDRRLAGTEGGACSSEYSIRVN